MALNFLSRIRALASNLSTLAEPAPWLSGALGGGGRSMSGRVVSPDTAMRVSAAYACVRVLAQTMASLPLTLYRRDPVTGATAPATDHPLYELVKWLPNPEMTSQDLRELMVVDLCLRGTSYRQIVREMGKVKEINPLRFDWTAMRRNDQGRIEYHYHPMGGEYEVLPVENVWRVPGLSFNGLQGLTPIAYAREAMGLSLAAEEQGARLFSNGMQSSMYVSVPGSPTVDKLDAMEDRITRRYSGVQNAGKVSVLPESAKFERIGMSAADAQLLEQRKFEIAEISRFYGVPLHLIAELDRSTNNNIEHQGIEFVTYTLLPIGTRIEQSMSRDLLLPSERKAGLYFKHNYAGLMRGDTASRYAAYRSAVGGPWMTPNEPREFEDMNPLPGYDVLYPPTNMGGDPAATTGKESA